MLKHLACIMDGNRRWAKRNGLAGWFGHKNGAEVVGMVIDFCIDQQIEHLSLYAFSLENFRRTQIELNYLFDLMLQQEEKMVEQSLDKNVRISFVGQRELLPPEIQALCERVEKKTDRCSGLKLQLLMSYGGQQEIIAGVQEIARAVQAGTVSPDSISLETVKKALWMGNIPAPELIVRTGGMHRLSNFLLFHAAYSEIRVLDCLWPDITRADLDNAVQSYYAAAKNFGV